MKKLKPDWPAGDVEAIQLVESLLGLLSFGECYEGVSVQLKFHDIKKNRVD